MARAAAGDGRRRSRRGLFWLIGLAVLAGLIAATWFGTAGVRTDRAIKFDEQARAALNSNDLGSAYQREQFAYALAPRDERALTLGALAYLRRDYAAAERHFRDADDGTAAVRDKALIGLAAAAAQAGDDGQFNRAVERIGRPANEGLRLALAGAAIDGGDLGRAANLLAADRPNTQNVAFVKALGQAGRDVPAAQKTLAAAGTGQFKPSFTDPAYERFIQDLTAVPKDGITRLSATLEQTAGVSAGVTRTVALAETLYGFGDYRAAERLARGAVQSQPDYRDGWNALAAAQISLREFRAAGQPLKISTDLDSSDGYTWYLRAQLADATGQKTQAAQYQKRAELLGYKK